MIHGYMPRGNVDEELYSPKGPKMGGIAIGILCLDVIWMPSPPGCVWNASTYDFPVRYKVVEGLQEWDICESEEDMFSPKILNKMIEGAKELEEQGVRAISGGCGFFGAFQKGVAAAVDVPVFLSSLCQIPLIRQGLKPGQKIGIITAESTQLVPEIFKQFGVDDISDLVIAGCQDYGEFYKVRASHNVGHFNPFKVEQDMATFAKEMVKEHPEIGAILQECAALPPYSWAVQNAVDLPVFDFYTLIHWIYTSVVQRPFSGFY